MILLLPCEPLPPMCDPVRVFGDPWRQWWLNDGGVRSYQPRHPFEVDVLCFHCVVIQVLVTTQSVMGEREGWVRNSEIQKKIAKYAWKTVIFVKNINILVNFWPPPKVRETLMTCREGSIVINDSQKGYDKTIERASKIIYRLQYKAALAGNILHSFTRSRNVF